MRQIKEVIVHVSDSPDHLDVGAAEIRRWHTDPPPKGRGWADIGYHYVVRRSGALEDGRPVDQIGAHCEGHNANSIGIVWVGRDHPTPVQYAALVEEVANLLEDYGLTPMDVKGHKEYNPGKTCPNLNMDNLRAALQDELKSRPPVPK